MKERLIGAVVLVVVAVILVPWLVSRAHHPEDVVTHGGWPADAATASRPYVLPLHATAAVAAAAATRAGAAGPGSPPALPRSPVTHATADAAAGRPAVSSERPKTGNAAAAGAGSPSTPSPDKGPAPAQGWSIQAASFSDIGAARALAAKLRQAGFQVGLSSHDVKGTTYYQVRVGPYDTEARARGAAPGVSRISNTKVLVRAPGSDNG